MKLPGVLIVLVIFCLLCENVTTKDKRYKYSVENLDYKVNTFEIISKKIPITKEKLEALRRRYENYKKRTATTATTAIPRQ